MINHSLENILDCYPIKRTDIIKGENATLFCSDGTKITDFEAGDWCCGLGHNNPRINSVIIDQISKITNLHSELTSSISQKAALNLLKQFHYTNGKAVFLNSGSEAVEFALRIARLISSGAKVLTFSVSYLSAFSSTSFPRTKDLWAEADFRQCVNCYEDTCTSNCPILGNIDFNDVSAFALEPGCSGGRVLFPPHKLVKFLAKEVKSHGGLIVVNEITTGLGRTGKWFGYNHYDIEPDIVALGKHIGNGYPVSAVVMSNEVACEVESKNFRYAQSHQNDPLGCTIANEVIDIMRDDGIIERSNELGTFFIDRLKEIQDLNPVISEIRGRGLMIAVEFRSKGIVEYVSERLMDRGYFTGSIPVLNTLRFSPALTISKGEIAGLCETLYDILNPLK